MHFQAALALACSFAAIPAFAAPAPAKAKSMMASTDEWTITSFTRTCNDDNTSCDYSFGIDTHTGDPQDCAYTITGSSAATATYSGQKCGSYTVSSSWSDQFGPGNGFSTLAVTDQTYIIYPAYTDTQLQNGVAVSPDQSYAPQSLP